MIININIKNILYNMILTIDCERKLIVTETNTREISEEKINDLLHIIKYWKKEYYKKSNLDMETYKIEIILPNGQKDILIGKGEYPDNYIEFKNWIGGIYD